MASLSGSSMGKSSKSGSSKGSRGAWDKGRSSKPDEENAYLSLSEYSPDRKALSESIQQHASILRGDDELDDETFADDDEYSAGPVKKITPSMSPGIGSAAGHSYNEPSTMQSESQEHQSTIQSESQEAPSTIQSESRSQRPSTINSDSRDPSNPYHYQYYDDASTRDGGYTLETESFAPGSTLPPPPPRDKFAAQYQSSLSTIQTNATSFRSVSNVGQEPTIPEEDIEARRTESSPFQPTKHPDEPWREPVPPVAAQSTMRPSSYEKPPPIPGVRRTFAVPLNATRESLTPSPGHSTDSKPLQPALRSSQKYKQTRGTQDVEVASIGSHHSGASYAPSQTSQSRVTFAETVHSHGAYTTNQPLGRAKRFRLILAVLCLAISLGITILYGHGDFGLWMTNQFVGSTAAKQGNYTGLPGAVGSKPAYNGTFEIPDLESMNIVLPTPAMEESLAEWRIPYPATTRADTPLFWAIPKAGGNVVIRTFVNCLGLIEASGEGAGHSEPTLQILETEQGTRYVNVDTTTPTGLERAKLLSLADSGMAEFMSTSLIPQASQVFTPDYKGRLFVIVREPMERSMSIYNQARARDPSVAEMSLAEYAANYLPNNEMVRTLAYKTSSEDLSEDDLHVAMEVLRRKGVVGLVDRIEESIERFYAYFGWQSIVVGRVLECQQELLAPNADRLASPSPGSEGYNFLFAQNRLDIRLYEYAQYLYDLQGGSSRQAQRL